MLHESDVIIVKARQPVRRRIQFGLGVNFTHRSRFEGNDTRD